MSVRVVCACVCVLARVRSIGAACQVGPQASIREAATDMGVARRQWLPCVGCVLVCAAGCVVACVSSCGLLLRVSPLGGACCAAAGVRVGQCKGAIALAS